MQPRWSHLILTGLVVAFFASCTSPLDLDTPRDRTAVNSHFPLPDNLRVQATSRSVKVVESDITGTPGWLSQSDATVTFGLDTTFHPPLQWIGGYLIANKTAMSKAPTLEEFHFAFDTLPCGDTVILSPSYLKVFASRLVGSTIIRDTLKGNELFGKLWTKCDVATHAVVDSLAMYAPDGLYGNPTVIGIVVMKYSY